MFARVLFPTDFSSYADSVIAYLPDLMSAGLREVILCSVIRSSGVREMLAVSTFENVARLSRRPVLVVRPQRS